MRYSVSLCIAISGLFLTNCATQQQNPIYQQSSKYTGNAHTQPYSAPLVQRASVQTQAPVSVTYATATRPVYTVQQASYTRVNQECLSNEANRKIIGTAAGGLVGAIAGRKIAGDNKTLGTIAGAAIGGLAGRGIADKTVNCDPVTISAGTAQIAVVTPAYQPASPSIYTASQTANVPQTSREPSIAENTNSLGADGTPGYYAVNGTFEAPSIPEAAAQTVAVSAPVTTAPSLANMRRYTIIPGDTVYSLSRSSCLSVEALKQANNINDDFYIRVGDEITIPTSNCID